MLFSTADGSGRLREAQDGSAVGDGVLCAVREAAGDGFPLCRPVLAEDVVLGWCPLATCIIEL